MLTTWVSFLLVGRQQMEKEKKKKKKRAATSLYSIESSLVALLARTKMCRAVHLLCCLHVVPN
jgi:hypothetical protein